LIGIAIIALVLGPKKLPQSAWSLGESKKEYKKSIKRTEGMRCDKVNYPYLVFRTRNGLQRSLN